MVCCFCKMPFLKYFNACQKINIMIKSEMTTFFVVCNITSTFCFIKLYFANDTFLVVLYMQYFYL